MTVIGAREVRCQASPFIPPNESIYADVDLLVSAGLIDVNDGAVYVATMKNLHALALPQAQLMLDHAGYLTAWNEGAEQLFGATV